MLRTYESWDAEYIAKGTITRAQVCSLTHVVFSVSLMRLLCCAVVVYVVLVPRYCSRTPHVHSTRCSFGSPFSALIERVHYFVRLDQVLRIFICGSSFGRGYYRCYLLAPHQRKTTTAHSSGYFFFVFLPPLFCLLSVVVVKVSYRGVQYGVSLNLRFMVAVLTMITIFASLSLTSVCL
jgi:hypothetical protein